MFSTDKNYFRYLNALESSSFFKDSTKDSIHQLLGHCKAEQWKIKSYRNSVDVSSTFHIIISGRLKVYKSNLETGREHTIFVLSDGDVFDIISLLDTKTHDVYWKALDDLEILKTSVPQMRHWISEFPQTHSAIFLYLGERMQQLMSVATDVTLYSTLVRLSNLLLSNTNSSTQELNLINNLSNKEIAGLIGTTRAVVNRHIQELKSCGAISVSRKKINITNLNLLFDIAEERFVP